MQYDTPIYNTIINNRFTSVTDGHRQWRMQSSKEHTRKMCIQIGWIWQVLMYTTNTEIWLNAFGDETLGRIRNRTNGWIDTNSSILRSFYVLCTRNTLYTPDSSHVQHNSGVEDRMIHWLLFWLTALIGLQRRKSEWGGRSCIVRYKDLEDGDRGLFERQR